MSESIFTNLNVMCLLLEIGLVNLKCLIEISGIVAGDFLKGYRSIGELEYLVF